MDTHGWHTRVHDVPRWYPYVGHRWHSQPCNCGDRGYRQPLLASPAVKAANQRDPGALMPPRIADLVGSWPRVFQVAPRSNSIFEQVSFVSSCSIRPSTPVRGRRLDWYALATSTDPVGHQKRVLRRRKKLKID